MKGMATKLQGQSVDDLSAPVNDGAAKFVSNFTKRNYSLKSIFKKKCVNDTDKCKEVLLPRSAFVDSDLLKGNVVNFTFSSETNVKNGENVPNVRSRSVSPLPRKICNDYSSVSHLRPPVENQDELTPDTRGEKSRSRFFTSHLVSDDESTPQTQNLSTTFLEELKISARSGTGTPSSHENPDECDGGGDDLRRKKGRLRGGAASPALGDGARMGFSACLQGPASHAALLGRQDAEVRLLDTMRRVLVARAKCDRDYSTALTHLAHTAAKMDIPDNVLQDSLLHKAWLVMLESLEEWSSLMRHNADVLVLEAVEKLAALITEKRASRKVYCEEHLRITNEVARYQEAVSKAKGHYEQALEHYKGAKAKYEDHYLKSKPGRKLDELKERYQKCCKKLHQLHNEYVLLLNEAADYERDFRTVLLPGLLEYQQTLQEDMVTKWRSILSEVCQLTDTTQGRYAHLQQLISAAVEAVSPTAEYQTFVETNRSTPPDAVVFEFSSSLLGDGVGSLQAGQLAVDSLTVDNLKQRLAELERRLRDVTSEHREKQSLLAQHEAEAANIKKNSAQDVAVASRLPVLKRASDVLRRELSELRCKQSWLENQRQLIDAPLTALGCEEAPQPWQTPSQIIFTNLNGDSTASPVRGDNLSVRSRSSAIKDILKKPFHRTRGGQGANSSESPTSTPPTPTRASTEEPAGGAEVPSGSPSSLPKAADVSSSASPTKTNGVGELTLDPERQLEDEPWFHGVLPREEVVRLLREDGDFLVRESTRNDERQVVLSVSWGTHKHFIVQTTPEGHYRFEGPAYPSIQELIIYQHKCGLPVTNKSGAVLRAPIFREHWELNNDDVQLVEKIGRGNFGDVYKARLAGSGLDAAVKTCRVTLPDEQKKKFLQEGRILKQYDHPNIVKFIGICVQKQPIMIVMELVPGGSLLSYVRSNKGKLTEKQMTGMCRDTAAGMAYLESKNCIHRDLAARNCLVGERTIVKISDFGMSREEEEYIVSDGMKQIPIKWTAPEALNFGKYTSLCDVWSYGVLCWEIFSGGEVPYHGYTNTKAREMIDSGYRMLAPPTTPKAMYQLMLDCWQYEPDNRPHFDAILNEVDNIYNSL
ncbi:tyrosine-protein kinase Fer isoform X2 [Hyalella azteca]|uniref:Tyrosine-protein kinase n=1 Tax=Hyalella azteca TaxID=294128 RepID=A0A979FM18_HYAAZ|nr:tyrosine-protein kinase Fer isoform X2 [Hyalella azteca]